VGREAQAGCKTNADKDPCSSHHEPRSPEAYLNDDEEKVGRKTEGSKEGLSRRTFPKRN
jgi:hypothetical protein